MQLRFDTPMKDKNQVQNEPFSNIIGFIWTQSPCLSDSMHNTTDNRKLTDTWPLMMTSSEKRTLTGLDFNLAFFAALINADFGD